MTEPTDLYPVIAQIAATFAGFGSLASGIGRRRGGDDARIDASRLARMLESSLSATLLGLLPATLASLSVQQETAIRASAVVALVAILAFMPAGMSRSYRIRHVSGFSKGALVANLACLTTGITSFALCALDVPPDRTAGLFLLGLLAMLGGTVVMFSRVIVSMLRPHANASDPG